jgi:hypothetical protein
MKRVLFELLIFLIMVGYIVIVENSIMRNPDSKIPPVVGIGIALLYTGLVVYSPRKIKYARWFAVISILAILFWAGLLAGFFRHPAF